MKLATWVQIEPECVDDPAIMAWLVPYSRQRARAMFLSWGYVAVGEWRQQVSDQHAHFSPTPKCILLTENYEAVPLPGLRGWWRRHTKGRHIK